MNYVTIKTATGAETAVWVKRVPIAGEYIMHEETTYKVMNVMHVHEGMAVCLCTVETHNPFTD